MVDASVVSTETVKEAIVIGYCVVLDCRGASIMGEVGFGPLHLIHYKVRNYFIFASVYRFCHIYYIIAPYLSLILRYDTHKYLS